MDEWFKLGISCTNVSLGEQLGAFYERSDLSHMEGQCLPVCNCELFSKKPGWRCIWSAASLSCLLFCAIHT